MCFDRNYPAAAVGEFAQRLEAGGVDQLWIIEDCFYTAGISLAATALARTERLQVGLGILPAVARNPAITAMELATPGWSYVFPKYSFEQLWAPSLSDIRIASLNDDDSDLLLTIPCGDGGETPVAEFRVRNGELKSAWPIDMSGMSDLLPVTEPTPAGMRKRVKLNNS